mgnify:FL=1
MANISKATAKKGAASCTATRNTRQRALVLEAVRSLHNHPTSADVYDAVREKHPSISRATVYRNLNVLTEQGEVLHIPVAGGADRYDFRCDCHYHAICRECGVVYDVEMPSEGLLSSVRDTHGFQIEGFDIIFTGLCPDCADKA